MVLADSEPKPGVYLTHELKDYLRAFQTLAHVHEYELIDGASRRILPAVAPACPPLLGVRPVIKTN
jgi:hypothetical protein